MALLIRVDGFEGVEEESFLLLLLSFLSIISARLPALLLSCIDECRGGGPVSPPPAWLMVEGVSEQVSERMSQSMRRVEYVEKQGEKSHETESLRLLLPRSPSACRPFMHVLELQTGSFLYFLLDISIL